MHYNNNIVLLKHFAKENWNTQFQQGSMPILKREPPTNLT